MMDPEQEKVLIASIERKMDNVLQSVRSRNRLSKGSENRKSGQSSNDLISPTTPGTGAYSTSPVPGASSASLVMPASSASASSEGVTVEQIAKKGEALKKAGLGFSLDDFRDEFSDGSDTEPLDTGMPVDSMLNFVPPTAAAADMNKKGSARKKERGYIDENGATEDNGQGVAKRRSRRKNEGETTGTPKKIPSFAGKLMKKITHGFRSPRPSKHESSDEK